MKLVKKFKEKYEYNITRSVAIDQMQIQECIKFANKWITLKEILDMFNLEDEVSTKKNLSRKLMKLTKFNYIQKRRRNSHEYEYRVKK